MQVGGDGDGARKRKTRRKQKERLDSAEAKKRLKEVRLL